MRFRSRKFAHVLERTGLAMAGAASGLFVAAHVGSAIAAFTSQAFLLVMMIGGAVGFYLGIDTPPLPFQEHIQTSNGEVKEKIDATEFLSAAGTFLATMRQKSGKRPCQSDFLHKTMANVAGKPPAVNRDFWQKQGRQDTIGVSVQFSHTCQSQSSRRQF